MELSLTLGSMVLQRTFLTSLLFLPIKKERLDLQWVSHEQQEISDEMSVEVSLICWKKPSVNLEF